MPIKITVFTKGHTKAFTLVELSIVIVIIGLIVAGITAGNSLARSAQLRKITTDVNKYNAATYAFKLQYDAQPGDFKNAVSYWGATTTDGNGNRKVEWPTETYLTWQHLALAGLVDGTYSGTATVNTAVPGVNIPKGPISGSGYNMSGHTGEQTGIPFFQIMVGKERSGSWADNSVLTTKEAYSLDIKTDDGIAGSGKIISYEGADYVPTATCSTPYFTINNQYMLTNTAIVCRIVFRL